MLLLDEEGREAAPGEAGEIAVRSRYLSLGYWRDPERTAAAFETLPNGEVLYRTGDLGRLVADGCYEHLGRKAQVAPERTRCAQSVELGLELIGGVQCALLRAPVKFVGPIRKQASQAIKIGPLFPGRTWCRIRPARVADALSKVRQSLCVDVDQERS